MQHDVRRLSLETAGRLRTMMAFGSEKRMPFTGAASSDPIEAA